MSWRMLLNSENPQETVKNLPRNRARDFRKFCGGFRNDGC
jgi:hypothetical protein